MFENGQKSKKVDIFQKTLFLKKIYISKKKLKIYFKIKIENKLNKILKFLF